MLRGFIRFDPAEYLSSASSTKGSTFESLSLGNGSDHKTFLGFVPRRLCKKDGRRRSRTTNEEAVKTASRVAVKSAKICTRALPCASETAILPGSPAPVARDKLCQIPFSSNECPRKADSGFKDPICMASLWSIMITQSCPD